MYNPTSILMNRISGTLRFIYIHPEEVVIILSSSTIDAIRISVYSPLNILLDVTPAWYKAI